MNTHSIADTPWLIYGANGYTGRLIAAEAARRGYRPVLAGRNRGEVEALAGELGLESRVFAIDGVARVAQALDGVALVLNCAGPFSQTADTMVQACISRGIHYLDISGEPDIYELHFARQQEAAAAGSVILPGVGFDVVPSDTLARALSDRLENAVSLELAFYGEGGGSAGSQKTVLEMLSDKCKVRRGGKIRRVAVARWRKPVRFSDREEWCMSIPWGDVSSAWHSTGIPDITMYMAMPRRAALVMRLLSPLVPLLGLPAIKKKMFAKIDASVRGPEREVREAGFMRLWGRACDRAGRCVEATLDTPEGFTFTTRSSLLCVERVLAGNLPGGCYTPTKAFGPGVALDIEGTAFSWRDQPAPDNP